MKKYLLHGKLKAKSGKGTELSTILLEAAQTLTAAKGCDLYAIAKDQADPDSVWVTEIWESKEDHDNSLKLDSVKAVIMKAMPILDGMPQKGQELEVLGGLGV
ncbi:MAG: antibiotic biosynthesis monooxygenase [Bacteroidia bacterium]|nr:antibiotic biosynthesis monooxygenase [Bacteroidia bacterium]